MLIKHCIILYSSRSLSHVASLFVLICIPSQSSFKQYLHFSFTCSCIFSCILITTPLSLYYKHYSIHINLIIFFTVRIVS
nr:MAG TPA: hypothetical protein [Caudoviricetes sp.]